MQQNKYIFNALVIAILLASLTFITITFLPFQTFEKLADSLMRDGNFKSLNENNAVIFRILLAAAGLILLTAAYLIRTNNSKTIRSWLNQYSADTIIFFKSVKPLKPNMFSLALISVITLLAVIIRLYQMNDPMAHDEAYTYIVFSSTSIFNIISNYHLPNNHILNSLLISLSTHLLGFQPWAVRLPAFLAGVLLIPASYSLATAIYDKYTAFLSAILVAILPGAILYATFGRGYSLVALFTIITLWLANYLRGNKNSFAWSLLVLFSALGFYSVPVMLFPFGMVFTWLFLENLLAEPGIYSSRIQFLKYCMIAGISTAVIVFILYIPVFIYSGVDKVFANQWVLPKSWEGYMLSIPSYLLTIGGEWVSGLPSLWTIILVAGLVIGLAFHSRVTRQRFPLQVAAFLWFTLLVIMQRPDRLTKIWVFLQAPLMIWCAAGITGLLKDLRSKFTWNLPAASIIVGIALIITSVNVSQIVPLIPSRWMEKGSVEKTVLSIKDQLTAEDLIIIDTPYDAAFWYYSRLYGVSDSHFNKDLPFNRLFVILSRTDQQTLQAVLERRGPEPASIDLEAAHFTLNHQNLDTYLIPHR